MKSERGRSRGVYLIDALCEVDDQVVFLLLLLLTLPIGLEVSKDLQFFEEKTR